MKGRNADTQRERARGERENVCERERGRKQWRKEERKEREEEKNERKKEGSEKIVTKPAAKTNHF